MQQLHNRVPGLISGGNTQEGKKIHVGNWNWELDQLGEGGGRGAWVDNTVPTHIWQMVLLEKG